jgi:hypothetical protein
MKRIVSLAIVSMIAMVLALVATKLFPRPPKEAAALVEPILYERLRADDYHHDQGLPAWNLAGHLEKLTTDKSAAANTASVILLDYYLGEHNGENSSLRRDQSRQQNPTALSEISSASRRFC